MYYPCPFHSLWQIKPWTPTDQASRLDYLQNLDTVALPTYPDANRILSLSL